MIKSLLYIVLGFVAAFALFGALLYIIPENPSLSDVQNSFDNMCEALYTREECLSAIIVDLADKHYLSEEEKSDIAELIRDYKKLVAKWVEQNPEREYFTITIKNKTYKLNEGKLLRVQEGK